MLKRELKKDDVFYVCRCGPDMIPYGPIYLDVIVTRVYKHTLEVLVLNGSWSYKTDKFGNAEPGFIMSNGKPSDSGARRVLDQTKVFKDSFEASKFLFGENKYHGFSRTEAEAWASRASRVWNRTGLSLRGSWMECG